jgi:MFS family permease
LSIAHIADFFIVYAVTAMVTRVLTRQSPARFGIRPLIFIGLAALVVSLLSYLMVSNERQLVLPGFFAGIAHALLFPAIVASGSATFPNRYRGLGNTVMLAMFDLGTLVGAPLVGAILQYSKSLSLAAYPTMFLTVAAGMTIVGVLYAIVTRNEAAAKSA